MDTNLAIDLSVKCLSPKLKLAPVYGNDQVSVVRPTPRPPWTILWYQSLWAQNHFFARNVHKSQKYETSTSYKSSFQEHSENPKESTTSRCISTTSKTDSERIMELEASELFEKNKNVKQLRNMTPLQPVMDVACCDGPVTFTRVSNPNFALTVEHHDSMNNDDLSSKPMEPQRHLVLKTYLCIYCNQSFKSLFCYQKHKKRHLNPVSVDITATHATSHRFPTEKKAKTKDLNVQFFPCKKCGCKFPSYYFVHKHRKVCHK